MAKKFGKKEWVDLFRQIGLDEMQMKQWHQSFEQQHPDRHQSFLEWLQIDAAEIAKIRQF